MPEFLPNYKPKSTTFTNTFCVFTEINPNLINLITPNYISSSGSKYFYTAQGMYRFSNHWGKLANCKWRLLSNTNVSTGKVKLGFANWETFYFDNNFDANFYLDVNYSEKTITYQHKNNPNYNSELPLFCYKDISKKIKQIKNLFELTNWAKYFNEDIEVLRKKIISELVETKSSLEEIKRKFL